MRKAIELVYRSFVLFEHLVDFLLQAVCILVHTFQQHGSGSPVQVLVMLFGCLVALESVQILVVRPGFIGVCKIVLEVLIALLGTGLEVFIEKILTVALE